MQNEIQEFNLVIKPTLISQGYELGKSEREGNSTARAINYYYSQLKKEFSMEMFVSLKKHLQIWNSQNNSLLQNSL